MFSFADHEVIQEYVLCTCVPVLHHQPPYVVRGSGIITAHEKERAMSEQIEQGGNYKTAIVKNNHPLTKYPEIRRVIAMDWRKGMEEVSAQKIIASFIGEDKVLETWVTSLCLY